MTILLFHIPKSSLTKCSLAFQNMICIVHGCSCIQVNQAECIPNVSQFGIILQCFLIEARKFSQKHDSTGLFEYEFLLMVIRTVAARARGFAFTFNVIIMCT
ncbi:hypothetical protein RF11_07352 [Thelohanellus kitauei]|uniref:Uncharacterized protein n=1 Tax=Thelohanellus kitauei TaxID=669202 RepID=A0A0C2IUT8_THEKT|nr:hypothetical protein RF11_07352 [Thelohanellus kitauei]